MWGATLLLALVTGCAAPPPAKEAPLNFSGRGVIALDAATIEVVDAYRPPRVRPHVDRLGERTGNRAISGVTECLQVKGLQSERGRQGHTQRAGYR